MKYRRYGKFRFCDYKSAWFAIAFYLVLMIIGLLLKTQICLLFVPLIIILIMVWSIYKPNSERFLISEDTITVMRYRTQQTIAIPYETTLIVSYADVCPPIAKRISFGNQTYMLKGRYAISILQKIPLESALERLHQNYAYKYTNSMVEEYFDGELYVYSFVGNQEILDKLLTNKKCQMIIPETLLSQISINSPKVNIYVDNGY